MPDLLLGGLDCSENPLVTLAVESLSDGCLLEGFNADVAAECARGCEERATRSVLEQIAREERSHADLSWALLNWLMRERGSQVQGAIESAVRDLERYPRPTAVSSDKRRLVARADPEKLRAHGRIPDERWAALWVARLARTRARVAKLLDAGLSALEVPVGTAVASLPAHGSTASLRLRCIAGSRCVAADPCRMRSVL